MEKYPVIIIPGFGRSKLIETNQNGEKISTAWPPEIDEKSLISSLKSDLMKLLLFKKDAGFSDKLAKIAADALEPLSLNEDGSSRHNVVPVSFEMPLSEYTEAQTSFVDGTLPTAELAEKIGKENIFYFAYNFLGDIFDTAERLNGFVALVKEKTGAGKVCFAPFSLGGAVLRAYFSLYGYGDAARVVSMLSAAMGVSAVADVLEGRLLLDEPAKALGSLGGKAASLASLVAMLPEEVTKAIIAKVLAALHEKVVDRCTTLWACVPKERLSGACSSVKAASPALAEKINALHSFDFSDALLKMSSDGVELYQIYGCGGSLPEIFASSGADCDGVVDSALASYGNVLEQSGFALEGLSHLGAAKNAQFVSLASRLIAGEGA